MNFISAYCFTHAFHSHDICQEFVKKWTGRIVSNSLFLREVTCCYKRLWEFSVTKPICYKDVFVNSFCSPTSRLANSLVVEPVLRLITKWLLNLELIPSSLRQNNNGDIFRIQCIVLVTCGHWQPHNIIFGMHCTGAVFTNVYLLICI